MDEESNDEWELSKENVQPLKQGRKFADLSAALSSTGTSLRVQKENFEAELRIYDGYDPLEVWLRYISWTEQNYPTGGSEGNLHQLLQKCAVHFKDDERYWNDERYINVWIKYASQSSEALDIYSYMYDHKMGNNVAGLFIAWANAMELIGNTKRADAIYSKGIELGAQPYQLLKNRHCEFQARVVRSTTENVANQNVASPLEEEPQRTTLGSLKTHGSRIPVNRATGIRPPSNQSTLGSSGMSNQQQKAGFQIFAEDTAQQVALPAQSGEYASVPVREVVTRENTQKPAKWTEHKIKQHRSGVGSNQNAATASSIVIHEDADIVQPSILPNRDPEAAGILRFLKRSTNEVLPWMSQAAEDPKVKVMYCKDKIYQGNLEFSFEELRAARYLAKRRTEKEMEKQGRIDSEKGPVPASGSLD